MNLRDKFSELLEDRLLAHYVLLDILVNDKSDQSKVTWLRASGTDFTEPFFSMTASRILAAAQRRAIMTSGVEALLRIGASRRCLPPSGFIYHVGRCGSTLVANMLKAVDRHFVLSEPTLPVEVMLRQGAQSEYVRFRDLTRGAILALGRAAPPNSRRFFIKLYHSHLLALPVIRDACPGIPEIFVYRDPVEVIMSMVATPGLPWLWHEHLTGLAPADAAEKPLIEIAARIVGRLLGAMLEHAGPKTVLLNYNQIDGATPGLLMTHFGIPRSSVTARLMASVLKLDAKDPGRMREFVADSDRKQKDASERARDVVKVHASAAYEELERRRVSSHLGSVPLGICV